jgi:predicted ATPase
MMTHAAEPEDGLELLLARDRMREWRFYDALRTDRDAPARRPQSVTYTPVLPSDGSALAAAILTIERIGDDAALAQAVADAFDGASLRASDAGDVEMHQPGLLRPLGLAELSDGTLRYLMLCAALLSPRPPELMVLNEPEGSLHPALIEPLARLLLQCGRAPNHLSTHAEPRGFWLESGEKAFVHVVQASGEDNQVVVRRKLYWRWPSR